MSNLCCKSPRNVAFWWLPAALFASGVLFQILRNWAKSFVGSTVANESINTSKSPSRNQGPAAAGKATASSSRRRRDHPHLVHASSQTAPLSEPPDLEKMPIAETVVGVERPKPTHNLPGSDLWHQGVVEESPRPHAIRWNKKCPIHSSSL